MSMFVPKSWLNIRILLAGFKQLLRQTWDHQNIHTYPPLGELSSKKASKILFDCLAWHLLSGRKVPCLLQLLVAAESNFQSNY